MVQKFASLILAVTLFSPSVSFAINFFLNPENQGNHFQTSERHLGVLFSCGKKKNSTKVVQNTAETDLTNCASLVCYLISENWTKL